MFRKPPCYGQPPPARRGRPHRAAVQQAAELPDAVGQYEQRTPDHGSAAIAAAVAGSPERLPAVAPRTPPPAVVPRVLARPWARHPGEQAARHAAPAGAPPDRG
ncbi:hypothetical protein [Kitasatospora sp. NPDC085464]|uniref:hypothetical protein n=1 Tax=Kitasatospora sp. NPDC085464 TaxID=3364063 RepID=UPI0037C7E1D8